MAWGYAIGAIAGALLNNMGDDEQTVRNELPPELRSLAEAVAQRGRELGELPFQAYPYAQVAPFTPYQFAGFDLTADRAMAPNALLQNAESSLASTLGGEFLNGNPYLDDIIRQTQDEVMGRMGTGAFASGSFGNAGVGQVAARELADAGTRLRFQNYNQERDRMMQGLGYAPSIYQLGYAPAQQLLGIGGVMQQQGQNELSSWFNEFMRAQDWPFRTFDPMLAPFGRQMGGSQTTTGPRPNVVSGMLGGAMLGNRLYQGGNWGNQGWNYNQQAPWGGAGNDGWYSDPFSGQ